MDPDLDLDAAAHQNLVDFTRWLVVLEPAADIHDDRGVLGFAGAADWPSSRLAVRADRDLPASEWVGAVDRFLGARGKTACVFARVDVDDDLLGPLETAGFHEFERTPEMVCDEPLPFRPAPDGIAVRPARDADDIAGYAAVAGEAFTHLGLLREPLQTQLDNPEALLAPEVAVTVAELDGRIVAGAMSVVVGEQSNGYVSWVACADAARGRGLGDAVTRSVTNAAFDRGAGLVTLEASKYGASTYRRMGYRELYRYRILVRI